VASGQLMSGLGAKVLTSVSLPRPDGIERLARFGPIAGLFRRACQPPL
jgi:hypothetical protein